MNGWGSDDPSLHTWINQTSLSFLAAKPQILSGDIPAQWQSNSFYCEWPCLVNLHIFPPVWNQQLGHLCFQSRFILFPFSWGQNSVLVGIQATVKEIQVISLDGAYRCHLRILYCVFDCTCWHFADVASLTSIVCRTSGRNFKCKVLKCIFLNKLRCYSSKENGNRDCSQAVS